jgi:hypothetical protein
LAALAVLGTVISFLGAFYYTGIQEIVAKSAGQNTMEWMTGDPVLSQLEVHARLFRVWLQGGQDPVFWTAKHVWVWDRPTGAQPWRTVNLRTFCQPQSFLLRFWHTPKHGRIRLIFFMYLACAILGPLLLAWVVIQSIKLTPQNEQPVLASVHEESCC